MAAPLCQFLARQLGTNHSSSFAQTQLHAHAPWLRVHEKAAAGVPTASSRSAALACSTHAPALLLPATQHLPCCAQVRTSNALESHLPQSPAAAWLAGDAATARCCNPCSTPAPQNIHVQAHNMPAQPIWQPHSAARPSLVVLAAVACGAGSLGDGLVLAFAAAAAVRRGIPAGWCVLLYHASQVRGCAWSGLQIHSRQYE